MHLRSLPSNFKFYTLLFIVNNYFKLKCINSYIIPLSKSSNAAPYIILNFGGVHIKETKICQEGNDVPERHFLKAKKSLHTI